jgi:hypothetical protein
MLMRAGAEDGAGNAVSYRDRNSSSARLTEVSFKQANAGKEKQATAAISAIRFFRLGILPPASGQILATLILI